MKLTKRQLSLKLNVSDVTIYLWEKNRVSPSLAQIPRIIELVSRDTFQAEAENLADKIKDYRQLHGLSQKKLAVLLGVDQTTTLEKTKSDRKRLVPINKPVLRELIKHKESHYLFINPRTLEPLQELKRSFKTACKKIRIEDLRFHDLRHTFASRLIEKGVDIITVKEILGHSSVRVTERYTHSSFPQKELAVRALE